MRLPGPVRIGWESVKADVPGGLEVGKIAAQGKWLVVEDVRNRRLLRFKVTKGR